MRCRPDDGAPTKIDSAYIFNADGTGEFDTNGKKMYSLRWTIAGEFLTLTYDNEQAPQGRRWRHPYALVGHSRQNAADPRSG